MTLRDYWEVIPQFVSYSSLRADNLYLFNQHSTSGAPLHFLFSESLCGEILQ